MSLYYYDKYSIISDSTYSNPTGWLSQGTFDGQVSGYPGWGFNEDDGFFTTGTWQVNPPLTIVYGGGGTSITAYSNRSDNKYDKSGQTCDIDSTYTKSTLIANNIVAEDGTYPNNGVQGGYWWVRIRRISNGLIAII